MDNKEVRIPKKVFWFGISVFAAILIALIVVVLKSNYAIKTPILEITPTSTDKDTAKQKQDNPTQISTASKNIPTNEGNKRKALIETKDSKIVVENQATNINTGQNDGVIGNNNSNIVINPKPKLTDYEKKQMIVDINQKFKLHGLDFRTGCIDVIVPVNNSNPDTNFYAQDIERYLMEQGYNVQNTIGVYHGETNYKSKITLDYDGASCIHVIVWLPVI